MKTQINHLVKGDHRTSTSGTSSKLRLEVATKVIAENPDSLTVKIRGRVIVLAANWSVSRKSVSYFGSIDIDLYREFFGEFGVPQNKQPEAYIQISGDMNVWLTTNSKTDFHNYIPNSEIEVL